MYVNVNKLNIYCFFKFELPNTIEICNCAQGGHKAKEAYNPGAGGVPKVFQRRHMASPHGLKDFIWHLPQSHQAASQLLSGGKFRIMRAAVLNCTLYSSL